MLVCERHCASNGLSFSSQWDSWEESRSVTANARRVIYGRRTFGRVPWRP